MEKTFSFYLKGREDAVEIDDAVKLEDDGTRVKVFDEHNTVIAVFVWTELQGYTVEE